MGSLIMKQRRLHDYTHQLSTRNQMGFCLLMYQPLCTGMLVKTIAV
uniref:Uncharacterized protein n=1 Tax=Rhizophora mucronata TaxID=61149 RepID=A0A2P2LJK9_RHIMU